MEDKLVKSLTDKYCITFDDGIEGKCNLVKYIGIELVKNILEDYQQFIIELIDGMISKKKSISEKHKNFYYPSQVEALIELKGKIERF